MTQINIHVTTHIERAYIVSGPLGHAGSSWVADHLGHRGHPPYGVTHDPDDPAKRGKTGEKISRAKGILICFESARPMPCPGW